jgi:hypothetical protein
VTERQQLDAAYGRRGGHHRKGKPFHLESCPTCETCGGRITVGQHRTGHTNRHHACREWDSLIGQRCTCPPGCTDVIVGDQGTCRPDCNPCTARTGTPYTDHPEWGRQKAPT